MRTGLLAAVALLAAPAAGVAADPPVVFQTQPLGRLLDDARGAVRLLGGDAAVEEFTKGIKAELGDKGFDGLDLTRPAAGYVAVPADPKGSVGVLALPVTGEKEFVDFCGRWNKSEPKALGGGVYELPAVGPGVKALARVVDGYAYLATAGPDVDLAKAVGADLVPFARLYDPAETAQVSARVYFDRFPQEVRGKAVAGLDEAKKALADMQLPPETGDAAKAAFDQLVTLSNRYLDLSKGAKEAGLRLNLDPATGTVTADVTVSAAEGSQLAKDIAGRKPTTNAFAGLLTPDVATGFRTRLPFFTDEIRKSAVIGLEAAQKEAGNNNFIGPAKPLVDELLAGAARTVKTGEVDVAGVVRGPDKDGFFTAVGAVAFADPSGVEKEAKKLIAAMAPPEFVDLIKWDAEKAGGVSIHVLELNKSPEDFAREAKKVFGDEVVVAAAFAPKGVYVAIGADAVAAVKGALALKPAEAPVVEVVLNPAKVVRLAGAVDERSAGAVAGAFGKDDKLLPVVSLGVSGGGELKVTFGLNLKLLTGAWLGRAGGPAPPNQ